jgi:hypothetical protein
MDVEEKSGHEAVTLARSVRAAELALLVGATRLVAGGLGEEVGGHRGQIPHLGAGARRQGYVGLVREATARTAKSPSELRLHRSPGE